MPLGACLSTMLTLTAVAPDDAVGPQPPEAALAEAEVASVLSNEATADASTVDAEATALDTWQEPGYEPEPEPAVDPEPRWDGGMFFSMGVAPMSTFHTRGFHPGVRYDIESGMAWERGRVRIWVGPDLHILQYFGRKKPGFGIDAMATLSLRHVYARVGAGTAVGIPASPDATDTRPMMGGLVGGGLVGRLDKAEGRLGLDYDVRMDTTGRVAQTILVTMRVSFGP